MHMTEAHLHTCCLALPLFLYQVFFIVVLLRCK